jgi:hypothetical protein
MFRIKHADNSWHMYGVDDAGTEYKDGVAGSYAVIGNLLTMHASGNVEISGYNDAGAAAVLLDQLVVLPWRPTSTMFIAWTADTAPFSPLPRLTAEGDFSPDSSLEVVGQVTNGKYKTKPNNPGAHVVNFQLTEIPYVS